jgi:uncharacterized protein
LAGEIIRTDFLPRFGNGDFAGGILQGARRVVEIVQRNQPLSADERRQFAERAENRPPALLTTPFFGLFVALGAFAAGLGFRSKTIFPLIWGSIFGGIPFAMALVPFFNASLWILIPLGGVMLAWGYTKGRSRGWMKSLRGTSRAGASSTGWVLGTRSSSSGSGGSGSSGDFGGGSSGGGGASGSW